MTVRGKGRTEIEHMTVYRALHRARHGAAILGGVFLCSVAVHQALNHCPLLESLYWTVITVAGVGYSQHVSESTGSGQQLLSIGVIVVGMLAVAYTLGMLIQAIIEGQFEKVLGVHRMKKEIDRLRNHIIICGFGRIGQSLARELAEHRVPFVVIDTCPTSLGEAKSCGYLFLEGDATDDDLLRNAGIDHARTIVIALHSDAANVFLTLTARNLNSDLRIVSRGEHPSTRKKLLQAGADQVVLPAVIGAERMADIILRPNSSALLKRVGHQTGLNADVEEFTLHPEHPFVGQSIREAQVRDRTRLLIVAICRQSGETIFNPGEDAVFQASDSLVVMGATADLEHFQSLPPMTRSGASC